MLLGAFLVPSDVAIKVGVSLSAIRLADLVMLTWSAVVLVRRLSEGTYVVVLSDALIALLVLWMELSLLVIQGPAGLGSAVGVRPVELLSAYLAGRFIFGNRAGLQAFVQVLLVVIFLLVLLGLVDLAAGENIISHLAGRAFGFDAAAIRLTQYRMGLPRARATFEHAILFGTFFSVCAPLVYYLSRGLLTWVPAMALCIAGTALALSSAPLLSFAIFVGLATFDRLLNRAPWRWTVLMALVLYGIVLMLVFVDDPLRTFVEVFTLDPQTGVYRFLIWEWVAYNLQSTPWFGIGTHDWVRLTSMIPSVDALWLGMALNAGYVGVALLAASIVGVFFVWLPKSARVLRDPWLDTAQKAVTITLVQLVFVSITVHFWGNIWAFFGILLGIRAGLSEARHLDVSDRRNPFSGLVPAQPPGWGGPRGREDIRPRDPARPAAIGRLPRAGGLQRLPPVTGPRAIARQGKAPDRAPSSGSGGDDEARQIDA